MRRNRKIDSSPASDVTDATGIGSLLVKLGKVSPTQLEHALSEQKDAGDALLGATLRRLGYATAFDVALAMKIQADLRDGRQVHAELDVLQAKVEETEASARALSHAIARARSKRRARGESSSLFLALSRPADA